MHFYILLTFVLDMNKIEHIGIAVKNMDISCDLYEKLLGKFLL